MKTWGVNLLAEPDFGQAWVAARHPEVRPSQLSLVTAHDVQRLRDELARGEVPPDLEAKLRRLATGDLGRCFIEQNCRTTIALLQAAREGSFPEASRAECERLLWVLAYVRKDDDAIPDYRPDGFFDDQQEVRAAANQLQPLLQAFKAWRLRHQVPSLWAQSAAPLARAC